MISTERNESEADRSQPIVRSTVKAKGVLQEALFACLAAATAITWPFVRPPAPLNLLELQSTVQYSTLLYFANNSHCFLKLQPGDLFNAYGV